MKMQYIRDLYDSLAASVNGDRMCNDMTLLTAKELGQTFTDYFHAAEFAFERLGTELTSALPNARKTRRL